jgi:16S rRNA (cytidine1402-2'-O)-methyltransferase
MEKCTSPQTAKLIYLSLPIGNLGDITERTLDALTQGLYFAVEDTRSFQDFLQKLNIDRAGKQIVSWHDQSEASNAKWVMEKLTQSLTVYIASEAGSPVISDPGFELVRVLRDSGVEFELDSYPGPSAVLHALELSELPPLPFFFHGFFPRQTAGKEATHHQVSRCAGTHIFFESPHRIRSSLEWMIEHWDKDQIVVVRELTKKFQTVYKMKHYAKVDDLENLERGELVVLYHYSHKSNNETFHSSLDINKLLETFWNSKKDKKSLAAMLSKLGGESSKDCYRKLTQGEDQ